jgi:hypothetical protein
LQDATNIRTLVSGYCCELPRLLERYRNAQVRRLPAKRRGRRRASERSRGVCPSRRRMRLRRKLWAGTQTRARSLALRLPAAV